MRFYARNGDIWNDVVIIIVVVVYTVGIIIIVFARWSRVGRGGISHIDHAPKFNKNEQSQQGLQRHYISQSWESMCCGIIIVCLVLLCLPSFACVVFLQAYFLGLGFSPNSRTCDFLLGLFDHCRIFLGFSCFLLLKQ